VLVTSRSALRIREEREYVVRPLSLPTSWTTAEALAESASGAFVLQRARELGPPLRLDAAETQALGQLCHRLAGLPLAIELATAHFRFLSPQDVLDRLDDLPGSAPRDLPERQQTMRATLDWSCGLLSVKQRALFSVFGAFHGGATLTTLEQVAAASGTLQAGDVLTLLQALIEHSLVLVTEDDFGRRYGMLEPVSQYARRLLVEDEAARIEAAHAGVFLGLAEQAAAGYEGPDQVRWLDRVQAEEANLLVAIDRCLDAEDGGRAARIIWAMWIFWWLRARPTAGRRRAVRCLSLPLPATARARVHLTAAVLSYAEADLRASAEHWAAGYELGMQEGDREIACAGRAGCGLAALGEGDVDTAETLFREALRLGEEAGPSGLWLRSLIYVWLGTILLVKGHPDAAAVQTERGLALARTRGDRLATYVALYNASQAAIALDDPDLARKRLTEGIILSQQTQDLANLGYFLDALGVVEATEDAPERAAVMFGAAQAMREAAGGKVYGYYLPDQSLRRKAEEQVRDALGEAAFGDAVEAGRSLDADQSVMFAAAPAAAAVRGHGPR
jgi:predicted ATPase